MRDNSKLAAHLAEEVLCFESESLGADEGDLETLQEAFGDNRIVGLGESAHGTREFTKVKHRILQYLVEELGVRVFSLESNFTETLAINRYVRHGEGDPEAALESIYVWTWNTEEMLALIEWFRAFNVNRSSDDQVRFYGFDIQHTKGPANAIMDYLDHVDPGYLETINEDLAVLADPGLQLTNADGLNERLSTADRIIPALRETLEERRSDYVVRGSKRAWELARQHVTVLGQGTEFGKAVHTARGRFNEEALLVRDRAMAENVAWIIEHEPTKCIAVWAHNDHINRVKTTSGGYCVASMGRYLAQWYGEAYYALGLEFGTGGFLSFVECDDWGWDYKVQECTIDGPLPDTVASTFAAIDRPFAFLDFQIGKTKPCLADWLNEEHKLHSVGATFDPKQPEKHVQSYVLGKAFDGLCYVKETTKARLLE